MRGRAARVLLFALIVAAQFLFFELALRRWGSSEAAPAFQGLFTGDEVIGYRLQPGARSTSRLPSSKPTSRSTRPVSETTRSSAPRHLVNDAS